MQKIYLLLIRNFPALLIFSLFIFLFYQTDESSIKAYPSPVKKIISLSPAITRELADLECADLVAGVTSYDDTILKNRTVVGSIVQPDIEMIAAIRPDVVLFSMEDNPIQHTERLGITGIPTLTFRLNKDFPSIVENYRTLAKLVGKEVQGEEKLKYYIGKRAAYRTAHTNARRVAFFVSQQPLIAATESSFIGSIIGDSGGVNILGSGHVPFTLLSVEYIVMQNPDIIVSIMPDAPEFFAALLKGFPGLNALKNGRIHFIRPDHVCYYTPADYVAAVEELAGLLHDRPVSP